MVEIKYIIKLFPRWVMQSDFLPMHSSPWLARFQFTQVTSHPGNSSFQVMSFFATAEHEKEKLQYFGSPEGRDDLYQYNQRERRTVVEVKYFNWQKISALCFFWFRSFTGSVLYNSLFHKTHSKRTSSNLLPLSSFFFLHSNIIFLVIKVLYSTSEHFGKIKEWTRITNPCR